MCASFKNRLGSRVVVTLSASPWIFRYTFYIRASPGKSLAGSHEEKGFRERREKSPGVALAYSESCDNGSWDSIAVGYSFIARTYTLSGNFQFYRAEFSLHWNGDACFMLFVCEMGAHARLLYCE